MTALDARLKRHAHLGRYIAKLTAGIEAARSEQNELGATIRSDIKSGATTGDRFRDHVLGHMGPGHEETADFWRDTNDQLTSHAHQLVLVIVPRKESNGCSGFGGEARRSTEYAIHLGLIGESELTFDDSGNPNLPTIRFASWDSGSRRDSVTEGALDKLYPHKPFDIHIGTEAVQAFASSTTHPMAIRNWLHTRGLDKLMAALDFSPDRLPI